MTTHRNILDSGLYQSNQKSLMKPCTTIYDLYSDYAYDTASDSCSDGKETVDITIVYDDLPFKEIIVTQAYDERSLIGDIAGIIGFLFCILQLPSLIGDFVSYCKQQFPISPKESQDGIDGNTVESASSNQLCIQIASDKAELKRLENRVKELEKIVKSILIDMMEETAV